MRTENDPAAVFLLSGGLDSSVVAALIQGHVGARVLSVELSGFDTHVGWARLGSGGHGEGE